MKKYRVPDKLLGKWIKCLDWCVDIWKDRAKGDIRFDDCPACELGHDEEIDKCKCPLMGKVKAEPSYTYGSVHWCCDGRYNPWRLSGLSEHASIVLKYIKSRRAGLIKRQKALKAKKVSK
jgi:hypothetical protein